MTLSNFLTGENIIFIFIYGSIILIVIIFFFIVIRFFIKIIIGTFKKIFHKKEIIKDQGSDLEVTVKELEESKEERRKIETQKSSAAGTGPKLDYINYSGNSKGLKGRSEPEKSDKQGYAEKEKKDIAEGLSKLKSNSSTGESSLQSKMPSRTEGQEENISKGIKIPRPEQRVIGGDQVTGKSYAEKEKKDIAEGLSKLKSDSSTGESSLQSKMPSRTEGQEENISKGIKIPASSGLYGQALVFEKEKIESAKKNLQEQNKVLGENVSGEKDTIADILKKPIADKEVSNKQAKSDSPFFGGESEISRIKLESKMKRDPKIWQAQRQVGLNLSPVERAKLIKEVFSSALGRNISKTDLQWSIKKLNQKMLDTKNPTEHAKIRKEIKFFKKIGGIK